MKLVGREVRHLLPILAFALLLPIPWLNFCVDGPGRAFAFVYLFLGCAMLAGEGCRHPFAGTPVERRRVWNARMFALACAGVVVSVTFSAAYWAVSGRVDSAVMVLAFLVIVPALCCVPGLTLFVGNPYVGVLFAASLLVIIKLTGCIIVRFVYGPNALAEGQMAMSWARPNLLVWLCFGGGMIASLILYFLGRRAFSRPGPEAGAPVGPFPSAVPS
jgi:hypothetical protein